jgi:hypothetical protein
MHRRKHEHRVIAFLQTVLGPEALESEVAVPRVAHSIDARLHIGEPTDLWGPLAPLVACRTVVIEHESRGPSRMKLHTAVAKVTWVAWDERPRQPGPRRRPPLLLFLSADCPRWVASGELGFGPGPCHGVHRLSWPLWPDVVLVHLRGLPDSPGLSLLRLMPPPRDPAEAEAGLRRLKEDPAVLQSTKDRVQEAIMNHQIPVTPPERWITVEAMRQEGRKEGLDEARREFALKLLARGTPATDVVELTGLTAEQVRALEH